MEVAWCSIHSITFTHAICFMVFTQDEVLTSGFWVVDFEGSSKIDAYGLGDDWDGLYFWEMGSLWDSMDYNALPLIWSLMMTYAHGWLP